MFKRLLISTLLLAALFLAACNGDSSEDESEEEEAIDVPVQVEKVAQKDFTRDHTYIGRTTPSDQMPVVPQGAGEVEELFVEAGDTVEEGDVLAEISSPQFGTIELESPMDGMVQQLNMTVDRPVSTEDPAAVIIAEDPVLITFSITAEDTNLIQKDDEVNYTASAAGQEGTAVITHVSPTAGENGMFTVEAEINDAEDFPIGITAQIQLQETVEENALVVPTGAIINEGNQNFVYIATDNQAKQVEVEILSMQSEETAVQPVEADGLSAGDELITQGQNALSDGQPIRIVGEEE